MTEAELIELLAELPDTDVLTVDETSGAPEIAWGDRLNVNAGRERFIELLGYPPGAVPDGVDYTAFDVVLRHPVHAPQAFVSVVDPGERARALIAFAHARAAGRD